MIKKIREICAINKSSLNKNDGFLNIEYLDTSSITNGIIENVQKLDIESVPSRAQRKVKDKTIVYSAVRPNLCHYGILNNPNENFIVSTGFVTLDVINSNEYDAYYIYYLLTQKSIVDYLQTIAENSVSSYPSLTPSDIGNLSFNFPSISEQRDFSKTLKLLDDKIKINKAINHNLATAA